MCVNYQAVNISRADYIPSDVDILYAEHVTSSNGLSSVDFSFPQLSPDENNDTTDQQNSLLRLVNKTTISQLILSF